MAVAMIYNCGWCGEKNTKLISALEYFDWVDSDLHPKAHYKHKCKSCQGTNLIVKDKYQPIGAVIPVKEEAEFHEVKADEDDE